MCERRNYWRGSTVVLRTPNTDDVGKTIVDFERRDYDSEAEWLADELHLPRSAQGCRYFWERTVRLVARMPLFCMIYACKPPLPKDEKWKKTRNVHNIVC